MAKFNALLTSATFASDDIADDIMTMQIGTPTNMIDVSGLSQAGFERLAGRKDCQISMTVAVNDSADSAHDIFSAASAGEVAGEFIVTTTAGAVFTATMVVSDYSVSFANDLGLTASVTLQMYDGTAGAWS